MIEAAFKHAVLHGLAFFRFALCEDFSDLMRHPAGVVGDPILTEFQEAIQSL